MTNAARIAFSETYNDAGLLREYIGQHFANYWHPGHGLPLNEAHRLHRLVQRLARLAGLPAAEVWQELAEDAENRY